MKRILLQSGEKYPCSGNEKNNQEACLYQCAHVIVSGDAANFSTTKIEKSPANNYGRSSFPNNNGISIIKVEPSPGLLSTRIVPPIVSTCVFTINNPNPFPSVLK